mmetsp:Transcript_24854/g.62520  ORF Transcript_24854/g.62520 Transcript_24854/m.62520 type:complete len:139 (-) Transcript_24854:415-831(-)
MHPGAPPASIRDVRDLQVLAQSRVARAPLSRRSTHAPAVCPYEQLKEHSLRCCGTSLSTNPQDKKLHLSEDAAERPLIVILDVKNETEGQSTTQAACVGKAPPLLFNDGYTNSSTDCRRWILLGRPARKQNSIVQCRS